MGDRLKFIEDSVAALSAQVGALYGETTVNTNGAKIDLQAQLENVATRVDRMELLLLRTPLEDFKLIDDTIATLLPPSPTASQFDSLPPSPTRRHEATDINTLPGKVADKSGFNISIDPDYIDQFCIDEADGKTENTNIDVVDVQRQCRLEQICPLNCLEADDLQHQEDASSDDAQDDELDAKALGDGQLEELAARVESGDLDIDELTDAEAKCVHSKLSSWDPWWQRAVGSSEAAEDDISGSPRRPVATGLKPPAHICCVQGRTPHASVALTCLSTLYAYVHTMRASNGGWEWAPLEAAPHLLHLCPVICSHQVCKSADECMRSSLAAAATLPGAGFGVDFDLLCMTDAQALIRAGADCCARALQEIVDIFEACLAGGGGGCRGDLRRGIKKLDFLTSFAFHHFDLLQPLAAVACFPSPQEAKSIY